MTSKPPKRFDAVFFDLDGTLLDTAPDFVRAMNELRQTRNLPPVPEAQVRNRVSDGARALITLAFDITEARPEFQPLLDEFLARYLENIARHTTLFPGMAQLLDQLEASGMPWGIVTNKPRRFTAPLLDAMNLADRAATVVCPDDVSYRKPHPEPLLLACRHTGADAANSLYVGDHVRDIEAGRNARMKTIAAAWGYIDDPKDAQAWSADWVAEHPSELPALVFGPEPASAGQVSFSR